MAPLCGCLFSFLTLLRTPSLFVGLCLISSMLLLFMPGDVCMINALGYFDIFEGEFS